MFIKHENRETKRCIKDGVEREKVGVDKELGDSSLLEKFISNTTYVIYKKPSQELHEVGRK